MEITSADILKKLPDFDDLLGIADEIAKAIVEKLTIEKEIKTAEAGILKTAMSNEAYFINGKPPSVVLIQTSYLYTGFNGELLPVRDRYIQAVARLDNLRSRLELYKDFFDMWRSLSASERAINA